MFASRYRDSLWFIDISCECVCVCRLFVRTREKFETNQTYFIIIIIECELRSTYLRFCIIIKWSEQIAIMLIIMHTWVGRWMDSNGDCIVIKNSVKPFNGSETIDARLNWKILFPFLFLIFLNSLSQSILAIEFECLQTITCRQWENVNRCATSVAK